jgi:hypothetical protein
VFALLTDLGRLPEWSTVTVATSDAPSGELRQGDRFRQTLRVVGKQMGWRTARRRPTAP